MLNHNILLTTCSDSDIVLNNVANCFCSKDYTNDPILIYKYKGSGIDIVHYERGICTLEVKP